MINSMLSTLVLTTCLLLSNSYGFADDERMFYVNVTKGTELAGQIVGIESFKVTTGFGEVSIPVEKIDGIKMDSDGQGSAVIAFTNGDMVTGTIELSDLQLKTNWGTAHIKSEAINSISSNQYGKFYSDPAGGGWRYTRGSSPQLQGSGARGTQPGQGIFNGR